MENQMPVIGGPRQTVDTVDIDGVRGLLVHQNGPAFFLPGDGSIVRLKSATWGGANMARHWNVVVHEDGTRQEATVLVRGDTHVRFFSPIFGGGWLVQLGRDMSVKRETGFVSERFEDDDGNVKLNMNWISMCVGRPEYAKKMSRSSTKNPRIEDPDEMNWITYGLQDGSILTFRRGGPPPPEGTFVEVRPDIYKQLSPKARKLYDAAKQAQSQMSISDAVENESQR